jgi:hypothetical protein
VIGKDSERLGVGRSGAEGERANGKGDEPSPHDVFFRERL